ncbi:MAG: hypothetical protein ABFS03_03950 [Chloroflexota bacterium]
MALSVREMTGGFNILPIGPFNELEAGIIAATVIKLIDGSDAGDPPMPLPGWIVGYMFSSEAGADFTIQFTKNGTKDTATTITVDAAKENAMLKPSEYVEFAAGDTIGLEVVADTTSKDFAGFILVALNTAGA